MRPPRQLLGRQLLDPAPHGLESATADRQVALALLEERHGLLEADLTALEPPDDGLERGERLLEGRLAGARLAHAAAFARAATLPPRMSIARSWPSRTAPASATTAPLPASRTIA